MAGTGSSFYLRVFVTLFMVVVLVQSNRVKVVKKPTCSKQLKIQKNKIPFFPTVPEKGTEPKICTSTRTCCTEDVENALKNEAEKILRNIISTNSKALKNAMSNLNMDLKAFCSKLINEGHKETLEYVRRSYGKVSEPSAALLGTLFKEMERYLLDDKVNLQTSLDIFFKDLFPVIYTNLPSVRLSQVKVKQSYVDCMVRKIDEIKPYGALPRQVHERLYDTLFPMRAFINGLEFGANLADSMGDLNNISNLCLDNFLKLNYCPLCNGVSNVKPCHQLCLDVYKGCLSMQMKIHGQWVSYMDAMETLADSLKNSLNMEKVVFTIHKNIYDAVTFVMTNMNTINKKSTAVCGNSPHLDYNNRLNRPGEAAPQPVNPAGALPLNPNPETKLSIFSNGIMMGDRADPLGGMPGSLSNKMEKIIEDMTVLKYHFASIPNTVCNKEKKSQVEKDEMCWNGKSKGKYTSPPNGVLVDVNQENTRKLQNIYAMFVAASKPINEAILLDKSGTRKDGDFFIDGSGSGDNEISGTGCDDDDEDCFSGYGSGRKPNRNKVNNNVDLGDKNADTTFVVDNNPDGIDENEIYDNNQNNDNDPNYVYTVPKSSAIFPQMSALLLAASSTLVLIHTCW